MHTDEESFETEPDPVSRQLASLDEYIYDHVGSEDGEPDEEIVEDWLQEVRNQTEQVNTAIDIVIEGGDPNEALSDARTVITSKVINEFMDGEIAEEIQRYASRDDLFLDDEEGRPYSVGRLEERYLTLKSFAESVVNFQRENSVEWDMEY